MIKAGVSLKRGVEAPRHATLLINNATAHALVGKTHHVARANPPSYFASTDLVLPFSFYHRRPLVLSCHSRSPISAVPPLVSCLKLPPLPSSSGMAGKGTITAYFGSGSSVAPGGDSEQPAPNFFWGQSPRPLSTDTLLLHPRETPVKVVELGSKLHSQ